MVALLEHFEGVVLLCGSASMLYFIFRLLMLIDYGNEWVDA